MHIKKTTPEDIEELMKLRLEMLRIVNKLDENATPLNEKIKILGLKMVDGKLEEVKA